MSDLEKRVWTTAAVFQNEAKTFCIRVTHCELPPRFLGQVPLTQYSWELQRMYDGRPARFFPVSCKTKKGEVEVEPFDISEVGPVLAQAEEWIRKQRQKREDRVKEANQDRD